MLRRWAMRIRYGRGGGSAALRAALVISVIISLLTVLDMQIRPMIKSMAAYQAKVYATRVINEAVNLQLGAADTSYDSLIRVTSDNSGRITSVQTDMVKLNLLKSALTNSAAEQLSLLQNQIIRIPVGTLSGWQIFSGRGPRVEFKIIPVGYIQSTINHRFDSAGINQTRHQIVLRIDANISAILPGYTAASEVSTDLILAETVIVGASPESFTQVLTGQQDMEGIIADYGNETWRKK